jgi:hypothetical protein
VTGHRSPEQALAAAVGVGQSMRLYPGKQARERRSAAPDQLALETSPDAPPGETETELGDLNFDRLAAAEERLLAAVAAAAKSPPCRCDHPLLDRDEWDDETHCVRCGRAVAA